MLEMYHFSWKRTKNMLEGRSRNKTITATDSKLTVIERVCSKAKYQSPCQPNQLWECVTVDRRPRLRKCRRNATASTTRPTPSTPTITTVKTCVCTKPRPDTEVNQGDMLPYEGECNLNWARGGLWKQLQSNMTCHAWWEQWHCNSVRIWLKLLLQEL